MTAIFKCDSCPYEHEESIKVPNHKCPVCGDKLHRVWTALPIHYKTGGFYNTDYKKEATK